MAGVAHRGSPSRETITATDLAWLTALGARTVWVSEVLADNCDRPGDAQYWHGRHYVLPSVPSGGGRFSA